MRTISQTMMLLVIAAISLTSTACHRLSNNKGKIEGTKWRLVHWSGASNNENAALKSGAGGSLFLEFEPDGKVTMTITSLFSTDSATGRYTLLAEDFVQFSGFPGQKAGMLGSIYDKTNLRITIDGDNMTLLTMDETLKFTRVK